MPSAFLDRLSVIVPSVHYDAIMASFTIQKPVTFRVNTLKANVEAVVAALKKDGFVIEAVPGFDNCFQVPLEDKARLTQHACFNSQLIYIQSLASQLPVQVLAPEPGEEICDLCAAPGSKTTQIAALMKNEGRLAAVEKIKSRFFRLQNNCREQGATCVRTYNKDGSGVGNVCENRFDRILLDAPCSSEGRITALDAASYQYWSLRKIKEMAHKQKRLLKSAIKALKPGGRLVYATCTMAPEENECVISQALKRYAGDISLEPIALPMQNTQAGLTQWDGKPLHPDCAKAVRVLPTATCDAFFMVCIKK